MWLINFFPLETGCEKWNTVTKGERREHSAQSSDHLVRMNNESTFSIMSVCQPFIQSLKERGKGLISQFAFLYCLNYSKNIKLYMFQPTVLFYEDITSGWELTDVWYSKYAVQNDKDSLCWRQCMIRSLTSQCPLPYNSSAYPSYEWNIFHNLCINVYTLM